MAERLKSDEGSLADARAAIFALLDARAPDETICPSEAARALAVGPDHGHEARDWRSLMPIVHASVDQLVGDGRIGLSWKGKALSERDGPYRISGKARD